MLPVIASRRMKFAGRLGICQLVEPFDVRSGDASLAMVLFDETGQCVRNFVDTDQKPVADDDSGNSSTSRRDIVLNPHIPKDPVSLFGGGVDSRDLESFTVLVLQWLQFLFGDHLAEWTLRR